MNKQKKSGNLFRVKNEKKKKKQTNKK